MKSRCHVWCVFLSVAAASVGVRGETIFNTLDSGTDGVAFVGDLVIEDLTIEGGGLLQSITIALTAEGGGEIAVTDVALSIAIDGGNGMPDITGDGDDAFVLQVTQPAVEVAVGGVTEVTFNVASTFTLMPENALLFSGVELTNPDVGHLFYGEPTVGSTNDIVLSFMQMGPVPVPSVTDPDLMHSHALAFRLDALPLPSSGEGVGVIGDVIDFESQDEGFLDTTVTIDGLTFSEARNGFPPPEDAIFAIDDGTGLWDANPAMLDFVGGKLLQINTFFSGPDSYSFPAFRSMHITPDSVNTGAQLSVAYVVETAEQDYSGGLIALVALMGGEIVAADVVGSDVELGETPSGSFSFGAARLEISGVAFDELVLLTGGPVPFGAVQLSTDNYVIGTGACGGDLDVSGVIDVTDLLALLAAWGACPGEGLCPADVNDDGMVDVADLLVLLANWGPCAFDSSVIRPTDQGDEATT